MAARFGAWRFTPLCCALNHHLGVTHRSGKGKETVSKSGSSILNDTERSNQEVLHHSTTATTSASTRSGLPQKDPRTDREVMLALLNEQRQRRIERREAFMDWQAGQREKGAAHRLVRQAKTQEKFKRHHYHTQRGRLIPIDLTQRQNPGSRGEGGDYNPIRENYKWERWREVTSASEFLVPRGKEGKASMTLHLRLEKR